MSQKYLDAYQAIENRRKESPDKSLRELLTGGNVSVAAYYRGRKLAGAVAKVKRASVAAARKRHAAPEGKNAAPIYAISSDQMIMLIGTPTQMQRYLVGQL